MVLNERDLFNMKREYGHLTRFKKPGSGRIITILSSEEKKRLLNIAKTAIDEYKRILNDKNYKNFSNDSKNSYKAYLNEMLRAMESGQLVYTFDELRYVLHDLSYYRKYKILPGFVRRLLEDKVFNGIEDNISRKNLAAIYRLYGSDKTEKDVIPQRFNRNFANAKAKFWEKRNTRININFKDNDKNTIKSKLSGFNFSTKPKPSYGDAYSMRKKVLRTLKSDSLAMENRNFGHHRIRNTAMNLKNRLNTVKAIPDRSKTLKVSKNSSGKPKTPVNIRLNKNTGAVSTLNRKRFKEATMPYDSKYNQSQLYKKYMNLKNKKNKTTEEKNMYNRLKNQFNVNPK